MSDEDLIKQAFEDLIKNLFKNFYDAYTASNSSTTEKRQSNSLQPLESRAAAQKSAA